MTKGNNRGQTRPKAKIEARRGQGQTSRPDEAKGKHRGQAKGKISKQQQKSTRRGQGRGQRANLGQITTITQNENNNLKKGRGQRANNLANKKITEEFKQPVEGNPPRAYARTHERNETISRLGPLAL